MIRRTQETRRIYKVFLASPHDVTAERSAALDVIIDLNRIYERQKNDYRLEVRAWEQHTYPNIGLPQKVINQQIPISECDIFIGVFWQRFGTPPGGTRPNDGRPYLSGTEEEVEIAIKARRENPDQRPIIMLYRKLDSVIGNMADDEHLQYARVIEFFEECKSEGSHPALIKEFQGDQFRSVLRDHLLQVVSDFESQLQSTYPVTGESALFISHLNNAPSEKMEVVPGAASRQIIVDTIELRAQLKKLDSVEIETLCLDHFPAIWDTFSRGLRRDEMINLLLAHCHRNPEEAGRLSALLPSIVDNGEWRDENSWLKRMGLSRNPFQYWITEDNLGFLSDYQVRPKVLRSQDGQIRNDVNSRWIFFANKGWGKTALCQMIAKGHYPLKEKADGLCIICSRSQFKRAVAFAGDSLEFLDTIHYIAVLQELILNGVNSRSPYDKLSEKSNAGTPKGLEDLVAIVHQHKFKYLMCLVDQVDEVSIVNSQPEKMVELLRPLLQVSWQTIPGITFRFFLPTRMERLLKAQNDLLRLDRYQVITLKWEPEDLQQLITQRLRASSKGLISFLGQLCEAGTDFDGPIDQSLVRMAEGSPRATIWLANRLIQLHCQSENPPRLIQPATWQRVQDDWQMDGRSQLFDSPERSKGFVIAAGHIYCQGRKIILSEKYDALLRCLIQARDRVCTKEELKKAGWPDDRPEGITEEALMEAMRRLKTELKRLGCDSGWIKTVRGRGYRLRNPQDKDEG